MNTFEMESKKVVIANLAYLCLFCKVISAAPDASTFKLVSGLQLDRVPSPSSQFYKEYVPLVYQFSIPRWSKNNTVIYGSQNCITSNYTKFFTTCPVLYYLPEMQERFSEYFINNQPLVANLDEISAKPETALIPFDCELVKPHFDDIYVDKVNLNEYLARLKSCSSLGSQEFINGITNYVYNVSGIYLEMRRNFYHEFWLKIDLIDGRVDAAIWANAINVFNSLMFENYMLESNRWKTAVMDCEAGRIPSTILPPSLLGDTLTEMLESLSTQNLVPTVSTDSLGNYYKSSLTDCTFTNDTFLVRILIPVIPKTERFLLMKVSPLPFYYKDPETQLDYQCQVAEEVLPPASGGDRNEAYVLIDLVKNIAYESDCVPGKLCHIPTALHPRKVSLCATSAFKYERYKSSDDSLWRDLTEYCPIKCSPVNKYKKEHFKQTGISEYFWFYGGSPKDPASVTINCTTGKSGSTTEYMRGKRLPVSYGSQSMQITCNCKLNYQVNGKSQLYLPKPCNGLYQAGTDIKFQPSIVAPVQWYSPEYLRQNNVKQVWNVTEKVFSRPNVNLVQESISRSQLSAQMGFGRTYPASESGSVNFNTVFLLLVTAVLAVTVVGLTWRVYTLIEQLQGMGLNVKGQGSYNVAGSSGNLGGDHQVSYRNMGSSIDTDSLLINEGR